MWHVDGSHKSLITVGNGGNTPTHAAVTLFYNQGKSSYTIEQQLEPQAINPQTTAVDTSISRTVSLGFSAGSGQGETLPETVSLSSGSESVTVMFNSVAGQSQSRTVTLTAQGNFATSGNASINVWFSVWVYVEFWKNCNFTSCPNAGSYYCKAACASGGYANPTPFMALTSTSVPCGTSVLLYNSATGYTTSIGVEIMAIIWGMRTGTRKRLFGGRGGRDERRSGCPASSRVRL
jgi:hypothetical protein